MVFDEIERLKSEWTDKYVVVDGGRPELARFQQSVGQVRTVNMNGRALVQFDRNADIAWYDIELPFLKQVSKPEPKAEEKGHRAPAETKTAAPAKSEPAKAATKGTEKPRATSDVLAAARGGAKPAPTAAGVTPSTKDILAAARAKAPSPPAAGAPSKPAKDVASPAPPKASAAPPAAKPTGGKLSTADILAAARGKAATANAPSDAAQAVEKPAKPPAPPAAAEFAPKASAAKPAAAKPASGDLPTTTAERIAWCRQRDTRG